MRIKLLFFSMLLWSIGVFAQTNTLSGHVRSQGEKSPVRGAVLTIKGTAQTTITDGEGSYLFEDLPEGQAVILVSAAGYLAREVVVDVEAGDNSRDIYVARMNFGSTSENNSYAFTESQIDEDSDVAAGSTAIISSSTNMYLNEVGYLFSPMRFRVRAYDSQYTNVYINGAKFNDNETGRFIYGLIGGLNDATRNKDGVSAYDPSRYSFGTIGGVSDIDMRASHYAAGSKLTLSGTNRNYRLRGMYTFSTGLSNKGWAFTGSVGYRWSNEGNIEGTFYNALSYFLSMEKVINERHSISISTWGAPTERAQQGASTQEAYDLAGSNYYNPNWGYQNGKKRNARVVRSYEPSAVFTWDFNINPETKLVTSLGVKYSNYGTSALGWYNNAADPRPDYWRKLPSYFTSEADIATATRLWQYDKSYRQIQWDDLYRANYAQNNFGGTASYILEERHNDQLAFNLNSTINHKFTDHINFTGGLEVSSTKGMHYKKLKDMLGANRFVDIDKFAARDWGISSDMAQNDLDNPNREINVGDKFGYNYNMYVQKANLWAQSQHRYNHWDIYYGARLGMVSMWRDGLMRNGRAADISKGKSETKTFLEYAAKAGLVYKINGKHFISLSGAFESRAPLAYNAFIAPRMHNLYAKDLSEELIGSVELTYGFNTAYVSGRVTGYFTNFDNVTELESFFNDDNGSYTYLSMSNIHKQHYGVEAAVQIKPLSNFSINLLATYSDAKYKNNPDATMTYEYSSEMETGERVMCEGFRVNGTPLSAYSIGIDYSYKGWFFNANLNYYHRVFLDFSTVRRLERFVVEGVDINGELGTGREEQEELDGGFMLDASIGKYIRLKKGKSISINLTVNNILNNTDLRTGGYEQNRIDGERYPSKYYYAQGTNAFLNFGFRF